MSAPHLLSAIMLLFAISLASCTQSREAEALNRAERVMVERPDSALAIIDSIDASALRSDRERARYALLKSMAIDKNYVDTTTFDILQPAIDYYPRHGSPDERLRTYYYQGRIYQNRHEYDSAMVCFIRGKEYSPLATDTLTAANLLVAQSLLLKQSYIFEDYIDLNLIAAKMYREIDRIDYEISSLNKALIGDIALEHEQQADSIVAVIEQIVGQNEILAADIIPTLISYIIRFGDKEDILNTISGYEPNDLTNDDLIIDFANAYRKLGDERNALRFLEATSPQGKLGIKYISSKPDILDLHGDKTAALEALRKAMSALDSINKEVFRNDLLFLQERQAIEKAELMAQRRMDRIIWISVCIVLGLLVAFCIFYYRYRLNRARSKSLLLERENMQHRLDELESESEKLKEVLGASKGMPEEVREAIQTRILMLNSYIAKQISNNNNYGKDYDAWVKEQTENAQEFMNSNRLALQASHPRFIQRLVLQGLTIKEINYACLYAIGLNGREIGAYMDKPSHIHISSAIRKKFDLDRHQTNLSIFIRGLLSEN